MFKTLRLKTKKLICCFALCLGIITSAFAGVMFTKQIDVSAQYTNKIVQDITSTVFSSGHNFNVTTSDSPVTPSGWTKLEDQSYNSDNIVKGVVNLQTETDFDTDECKTSRPIMPLADKDSAYYKNLMINSHNGAGRYGYKSSSITLEEDSYYQISVYLYTQKTSTDAGETDARASIYLTGLLDEDEQNYSQTKFEYFTTLASWEEYIFYVATDDQASINLELWLGSKTSNVEGAVFFNNVSILRYSEDAFFEQTANLSDTTTDNFNLIDVTTPTIEPVENSDFEDVSLSSWTKFSQSTSLTSEQLAKCVDSNTFTYTNDDTTVVTPGTNCSYKNNLSLFLYNAVDGYQGLKSSEFTINKQTYYKLSFWAKSNCGTGSGATVMLVDSDKKDPATSATLTTATTATVDSNTFRNDWTQYSFYIYGPAKGTKTATIQIWLGTQDSPTAGYVFIDDFSIEIIDYTTYSENSSNSNSTTFNLNDGSDKYTVTNSNFNKTENSSTDTTYPAKPSNWERSGSDNTTTLSGVVNTTQENWDEIDFGSNSPFAKPQSLPNQNTDDNNVLMIGSSNITNSQTYTSNSLTLSANSYYSISFYVMTSYNRLSEDYNYGARVNISSSTKTLFEYFNIYYSDNGWHKVEARIKTGFNDETAQVKLMFENATGYVFFDKVELKTISEAIYNNTSLLDGDVEYYKVDLSYDNFNNNCVNKNIANSNGIDTVDNWSFANNSNTYGNVSNGIININNTLLEDVPNSLSGQQNFLYISTLHDAYYSYTSKESFTFTAGTYYKVSVNVLTRYIDKEEDKEEDISYGASIALTASDELYLKGIDTEGVWKNYTIYVNFTEDTTTNIALALGYTDETVKGEVLFDKITISQIADEATYKQEISDANLDTIKAFIDYVAPSEDNDEESSIWESNFDWLLVPSIITGLAIIIAVVGFYVRRIRFNRKPKIKTNYDRRKTLDKDIERREKIALRQQIIEELNAELAEIDKEIEAYNAESAQKLEELKAQVKAEQEELEKAKLELEIRKKEATAERERKIKESAEFASDKKAEKEYNDFISKLDKQELSVQKKITAKEMKITYATDANKDKIVRFTERQEYIRLQIAKIEAEIEEIAKQEEAIWAEYKAAKEDAKRRKAEYKASLKLEKEQAKKVKQQNKSIKNSEKDDSSKK